jgi:hypothetical protein
LSPDSVSAWTPPAPRAELLHVLMLPDIDRVGSIATGLTMTSAASAPSPQSDHDVGRHQHQGCPNSP